MSGELNSEMKPKVARAKAVINHILNASTFDLHKAEAVFCLIEWLHGVYWNLTGEEYMAIKTPVNDEVENALVDDRESERVDAPLLKSSI